MANTWSVYLRETFVPKRFYVFDGLAPGLYIYVLESKTLAGRERRHRDDAQGRPMVVTFFERIEDDHMNVLVRRTDRSSDAMAIKTMTCAELLLAVGHRIDPDPERSARDAELILERAYADRKRLVFDHKQMPNPDDVHVYQLNNPTDAEDLYLGTDPGDLRKIAMARLAEKQYGWNREQLWKRLNLEPLRDAVNSGVCPPGCEGVAPGPAAPVAKAGAKAKAKGKAKAKPKAKAKAKAKA